MPGEPIKLDHNDSGNRYPGWSHKRCNASAAVKGNRAQAAAYRAAMGLPEPKVTAGSGDISTTQGKKLTIPSGVGAARMTRTPRSAAAAMAGIGDAVMDGESRVRETAMRAAALVLADVRADEEGVAVLSGGC